MAHFISLHVWRVDIWIIIVTAKENIKEMKGVDQSDS